MGAVGKSVYFTRCRERQGGLRGVQSERLPALFPGTYCFKKAFFKRIGTTGGEGQLNGKQIHLYLPIGYHGNESEAGEIYAVAF